MSTNHSPHEASDERPYAFGTLAAIAVGWVSLGITSLALAFVSLLGCEFEPDALDGLPFLTCGAPGLFVFGWIPGVFRMARGKKGAVLSFVLMALIAFGFLIVGVSMLRDRGYC